MGLFTRKKKEQGPSISESQGVPEGTFRCDVCSLVQPVGCLCGSVVHGAGHGLPDEVFHLCGVCALWLGYGQVRFPQGICFNFSTDQAKMILELRNEMKLLDRPPSPGEPIPVMPNALELSKIRMQVTPAHIQSLTDRLSHGGHVDPEEIERANRG
jgi:hypothetical protein